MMLVTTLKETLNSGVDDVQAEKPEQERVIELYLSVYPRDHVFDYDQDCQNMLR